MTSLHRISIGPLELDAGHKVLWYGERSCALEDRHCRVLERLAQEMGPEKKVVAESELYIALGRSSRSSAGTTLASIISEIRAAIKTLGASNLVTIKNVTNAGYYIEVDDIFTVAKSDDNTHLQGSFSPGKRSRLAAPTEDAVAFAAAFNSKDKRIVGDVIEAYAHPFLGYGQSPRDIGWSPAEITLRLRDTPFDAGEILNDPEIRAAFEANEEARKLVGKGTALEEPSYPKYTIVDQSFPFPDRNNLVVTLGRTDYFTILRVRPGIAKSVDTRKTFGHIDGSKTRIPQATGLQVTVVFTDGQILAIQRSKDSFPFPGTWSFSAEEQLSEIDLSWPKEVRMERFVLRTAIEEIFPLARKPKQDLLANVMAFVRPYIASMQIWSIFLEEPTSTLQFFSVIELNLTTTQYKVLVNDLVQEGMGLPSQEGKYFAISQSDIESLLEGNPIKATDLFGEKQEEVSPSLLHPTSRYRLLRLLDCII
jgi:DNA-binding winged helix-turn-helix (wHTH) protein